MNNAVRKWLLLFAFVARLLCKTIFSVALICPQAISEMGLSAHERKLLTADSYHTLWVRVFFSSSHALDLVDRKKVAVRSGMIREMNIYNGFYPDCYGSRFCREVVMERSGLIRELSAHRLLSRHHDELIVEPRYRNEFTHRPDNEEDSSYERMSFSNQWHEIRAPRFFRQDIPAFFMSANTGPAVSTKGGQGLRAYSDPVPLPVSGSIMNYSMGLLLLFGRYSKRLFRTAS